MSSFAFFIDIVVRQMGHWQLIKVNVLCWRAIIKIELGTSNRRRGYNKILFKGKLFLSYTGTIKGKYFGGYTDTIILF